MRRKKEWKVCNIWMIGMKRRLSIRRRKLMQKGLIQKHMSNIKENLPIIMEKRKARKTRTRIKKHSYKISFIMRNKSREPKKLPR